MIACPKDLIFLVQPGRKRFIDLGTGATMSSRDSRLPRTVSLKVSCWLPPFFAVR